MNTIVVRASSSSLDHKERIEHARRYTEQRPSDPYGWLLLGNLQDDAGDFEAALVAYQNGHKADPTEYRTIISSCRMLGKLDREDEALRMAEAGVASGALNDRWQRPSHFVHGLSASAWKDVSNWRLRRVLEGNFAMIQEEILSIFDTGILQKEGAEDTERLTQSGSWKELNLIFQGVQQVQNAKLCPNTVALIEAEIPEAASMVRGAAKVSILTPGTVIKPHHGPSNTRMRSHLGIRIPSGCYIRAGDPEDKSNLRQWEEGKLLCFDDSYRHEVWHEGSEPRIILTVDVWHPEMDHTMRLAACENEHQRQVYLARYQIAKDGVGWDSFSAKGASISLDNLDTQEEATLGSIFGSFDLLLDEIAFRDSLRKCDELIDFFTARSPLFKKQNLRM